MIYQNFYLIFGLFLTFDKKHVDAKSGVTKLGGVEKPWTTPAKDEISVKISKSYKAI